MGVINRCAIAVAPLEPMQRWSRPFWTREDMEGLADDHSLYLIPAYDTEAEAEALLMEHWPAIFTAELDLWCRDGQQWPQPRSYGLFREWFSVRFFPLVEDLGKNDLRTYNVNEGFRAGVRTALS